MLLTCFQHLTLNNWLIGNFYCKETLQTLASIERAVPPYLPAADTAFECSGTETTNRHRGQVSEKTAPCKCACHTSEV